jgi:hypothetical protein
LRRSQGTGGREKEEERTTDSVVDGEWNSLGRWKEEQPPFNHQSSKS